MRRRKMLQVSALFSIGAASSALINACSSNQSTSNAPAVNAGTGSKALEIAAIPWIGWGQIHIAEAKGFFKEAGLNVKQTVFQTVTEVNTALLAKKADLACLVACDLLTLTAQASDLKFILASDYSGEVDSIVGAGIQSPADLKGKKLAREDIPYEVVFVEKYLQSIGLTDKDVEIVSLPVPDAAAAFAAGKVDAAAIYEPFVGKVLKERAGSTRLFTAKDTNIIINGLAGSQAALSARREEVVGYLRALEKATKFIQTNQKEAYELLAKWTGVTAEDVAAQMKQVKTLDTAANKTIAFADGNPLNIASSIDAAGPILVKTGKAPKLVAGKDLVDGSFVSAV